MDLRVISIGALPAHPLRNERGAVRTGHATTLLITTTGEPGGLDEPDDADAPRSAPRRGRGRTRRILVDPALPAPALLARLHERAGIGPGDITDVFLTSFKPDARRAIEAFEDAAWWIAEAEREGVGVPLIQSLRKAADAGDAELTVALERDVAILQRCKPAPDRLADHVDLFPLPGVTPGTCGLLLEEPRHTTVVCGDAIPTVEHLEQGKALQGAFDVELAKRSFEDAVEVADLLALGRDNIVVNPTKRPF